MDLDRTAAFGAVDPADALGDVEAAPEHWAQAAQHPAPRAALDDANAVVVAGMGGSAIAGDIARAIAEAQGFERPVVVHRGYGLPAFAGPRTVVACVSYSGGTEETVDAFAEGVRRGCRLLAVAGGGALSAAAAEAGAPVAHVPGGLMPRHATGWLAAPLLGALGLAGDLEAAVAVARAVVAASERAVPVAQNPAKQLGLLLAGSGHPLVWGGAGLAAVAAHRLKCQLNENAKMTVLGGELPEADHNEIVAWQEPASLAGTGALVVVRDEPGEHPRLAARWAATLDLLAGTGVAVRTVAAEPGPPLARLLSLLVTLDLASVYAALALDRDPTPIPHIDRLKAALAALPAPAADVRDAAVPGSP